ERLHERICDLLGEPLLNLESPSEQIDDAWDLGQPDDVAARKVADVYAAVERQQMVLAERIELNVAHDHWAFALGREHAVADCGLEAGRVAADEIPQGFRVTLR